MKMCLRVLKESIKSRFDSYSRQEQGIDHIPYCLSFCPTTFLEIAVYNESVILYQYVMFHFVEHGLKKTHLRGQLQSYFHTLSDTVTRRVKHVISRWTL